MRSEQTLGVEVFLLISSLIPIPYCIQANKIFLRDNTAKGLEVTNNVVPGLSGDSLTFSLLKSPASEYFTLHNSTGQLQSARTIDRDLLCAEAELCCTMVRIDLGSMMHTRNICPNHLHGLETQVCIFNLSVSVVTTRGRQPDIYDVEVVICEENDHTPTFKLNQKMEAANKLRFNAEDNLEPYSDRSTFIFTVNISESAPIGHRVRLPLAEDIDASPFHVQRYTLEHSYTNPYVPSGLHTSPFRLEISRDTGRHVANHDLPDIQDFHTVDQKGTIIGVELVLNEYLDRERMPEYNYRLLAVDGGIPPRTGTMQLHVRVVDMNDHSPQFSKSVYQASVDENTVGTEILRVLATDLDEGPNAVIRYAWASDGIVSDTNGLQGARSASKSKEDLSKAPPSYWFDLNSETGSLYVKQSLDYEIRRQYKFQVIAYNPLSVASKLPNPSDMESQSLTATSTVIIDVRNLHDEAPQIIVDYANGGSEEYKEIRENGPTSYFVAFITASDPDLDEESAATFDAYNENMLTSYPVTCRLNSHQETYQLNRDQIIRTNSILSVRYSLSTRVPLDRELSKEDRIIIVCEDAGTPSKTATASVTVKILDENDCEPELQVFIPDSGSRPKLVKPWPSEFLKHVIDNYPSSPVPLLTAYASDTPVYSIQVRENQPIGAVIAHLHAKDNDDGDNGRVTFELPNVPVLLKSSRDPNRMQNIYLKGMSKVELFSSPEALEYFQLDEVRGDVLTSKQIDRENIFSLLDHLFVVVKATDHGSSNKHSVHALLHVIIIDENDNPPTFINPTMHFEIAENVPAPALVGEVIVSDPDVDRSGRMVEDSSFSKMIAPMIGNYHAQSNRLHVRIDPGHGRQNLPFILYRSSNGKYLLNTTRVLDRESEQAFQFNLIATDNDQLHVPVTHSDSRIRHGHTTSASVLVTVVDVNDNQPEVIFPNPITSNASVHRVSYREAAGHDIININANDRDASEANGKFHFEIVPNSRSIELFTIDRDAGVLRTRRRLTKDDIGEHVLQILVKDEGNPPLETRLTLRLSVDRSEPHHQSDIHPTNGASGAYGLSRELMINARRAPYEQGNPISSTWDFRRLIQSDILLIIIVAMIMLLILIMISLCFYLRHKRKMFGFLPDLYALCLRNVTSTNGNNTVYNHKTSVYSKNRTTSSDKRNAYPHDATYSGLMDSLLASEQRSPMKMADITGQTTSLFHTHSPIHHPSYLNTMSHRRSSSDLNQYANKDPGCLLENRSRMSFSPTVIGSDCLFSSNAVVLPPYRPETSMAVTIPDVADHAETSRKFYLDYNRIDQPFSTQFLRKPAGGGTLNAYNLGQHTFDARQNDRDIRCPQVDFRPINDEVHMYQRIHPENTVDGPILCPEKQFITVPMQNSKQDQKQPSFSGPQHHIGFPDGFASWRSDPSLCQDQHGYEAEINDTRTLGASWTRNAELRRSNSDMHITLTHSEVPFKKVYYSTFRGPKDKSKSVKDQITQDNRNYTVAIPRIQASFV